eukprot:5869154-Prymnesium_polylepis.1
MLCAGHTTKTAVGECRLSACSTSLIVGALPCVEGVNKCTASDDAAPFTSLVTRDASALSLAAGTTKSQDAPPTGAPGASRASCFHSTLQSELGGPVGA